MTTGFFALSEIRSKPKVPLVAECGSCGIYKQCLSPKMKVSGLGKKKILIVGEAPGKEEDKQNRPFVGNSGRRLRSMMDKLGVDLNEDCWRTNALICRPPENRTPTMAEIGYCRPNILKAIAKLQPVMVLLLGATALKSVIGYYWKEDTGPISRWAGFAIPSIDLNTWLCPTYHPAYIEREDKPHLTDMFQSHLGQAVYLCSSRPHHDPPDYKKQVKVIMDPNEAASIIRKHMHNFASAAFDYETNMLKPEGEGAEIVSCAIAWAGGDCIAYPWHGEAIVATREFVRSKIYKVASNMKYEDRWTRVILKTEVRNWHWDTMQAAHIIDNRPWISGLKFQAFVNLGIGDYDSHIKPYFEVQGGMKQNRIREIDIRDLLLYNGVDALLELNIAMKQKAVMGTVQAKGYNLMHGGALALSKVEANGIRIDKKYLKTATQKAKDRITAGEERLKQSQVYKAWRRAYGVKTNLDSTQQLGKVLFSILKYKSVERTNTGRPKTDIDSLGTLNIPFVNNYLLVKKQKKALGTYLKGIAREVDPEWLLHVIFDLHTVVTYRGSCSKPNFQNIPTRDEKIKKLIRQCFIARPGHRLVEIDYSGLEVNIAACYHKDPAMLKYINDPTKDMHRDMAAECFKCKPDQVGKVERYCGKNMFVFPQFYGSIFVDCAQNLWTAMKQMNLMVDMIPMREHLKRQGIKGLGNLNPNASHSKRSFVGHIKEIERKLWEERFPIYAQWKQDWWERYLKQGYFNTLTNFTCSGYYKRNEVINYPVQGSAFHCLLWSLIELQKEIKKRELKTKIVGQIHDSIIADVPEAEFEEYITLAREIMCERIRWNWKWIIVPLDIEIAATPVNGNWFEMEEVKS